MEILPEEVALKYGYPAVQRVVNIVLRRRFRTTTVELRGTGELLGKRQSGLTDFRFARLVADRALLDAARVEAGALAGAVTPPDEDVERLFGGDAAAAWGTSGVPAPRGAGSLPRVWSDAG